MIYDSRKKDFRINTKPPFHKNIILDKEKINENYKITNWCNTFEFEKFNI
jgi:hypothetical protein